MIRLLFITDFTESFAYALLRGILRYSQQTQHWVVCRMPPAHKNRLGIEGVVDWAIKWKADVVIGQFEETDNLELFKQNGIVVFAQDYKKIFSSIPNITGEYHLTGRMAADHFLEKGFRNFGFFGYRNVCWSDERCVGFLDRIRKAGYADNFHSYRMQEIDNLWYYEQDSLTSWLKSIPKPIAIMACDDNQANFLIEACQVAGVNIPSEVSVIGVDNDEVIDNLSSPTISSISVDIEQGGYETAQMAERLLQDPDYKAHDIVLMPKMVVPRMSTAAYATSDTEILKAIRFIHQHADSKIDVGDVLEHVALSRRLLEIRFKQVTGDTVYGYISKERIRRFAALLLDHSESVSEVAAMMGEDDPKVICRRFKALKGMTPHEWRRLHSR